MLQPLPLQHVCYSTRSHYYCSAIKSLLASTTDTQVAGHLRSSCGAVSGWQISPAQKKSGSRRCCRALDPATRKGNKSHFPQYMRRAGWVAPTTQLACCTIFGQWLGVWPQGSGPFGLCPLLFFSEYTTMVS
jgi:hypothetical protein